MEESKGWYIAIAPELERAHTWNTARVEPGRMDRIRMRFFVTSNRFARAVLK